MYKNLNIAKYFDIETFISDLPELIVPNKASPEITNKEKLNQHSKKVIDLQAGNFDDLNINLQNSFQYLNYMRDNLENDVTDDIDAIHPIGGLKR